MMPEKSILFLGIKNCTSLGCLTSSSVPAAPNEKRLIMLWSKLQSTQNDTELIFLLFLRSCIVRERLKTVSNRFEPFVIQASITCVTQVVCSS